MLYLLNVVTIQLIYTLNLTNFTFMKFTVDMLNELYKSNEYIPYSEYLKTDEWKSKRLEILDRDNFRCINCGGYETEFLKKKNSINEFSLIWSQIKFIFWTDINGKGRTSKLITPKGEPDKSYNLQVHHKKYIINKLPWDYLNNDLETLCNYCHTEVHRNETIPIYSEDGLSIVQYKNCDRCGGTGYFPEYKHIQNGVCFKCNGARFSVLLLNK